MATEATCIHLYISPHQSQMLSDLYREDSTLLPDSKNRPHGFLNAAYGENRVGTC